MDILTLDELKQMMDPHTDWCVSLFMPTHRMGRETEQDPIRYKNLLREVENRLAEKGLRTSEIQSFLSPAQRLLQDYSYWRHQSDSLAVFFTPEAFHSYRLPIRSEELVVISNRFHLKPLLPLFTSHGHFYILALSQNQVRLLEGTRHTVDEIDLETIPASMAEALQYERFDKQLQFHTGTSSGTGKRAAIFHGHDVSDEDKSKILRWFHKIDDELPKLLSDGHSPLVLAGVEYLFPLYQKANSYANLLEQGIPGNPEELKPDELHARAWPLVQPTFLQAQEKAASQYSQLAGTEQTTTDIIAAVQAAYHGRVELLFVVLGVQIWGKYEPETDVVTVHEEHEPGDEDLLDLVAIQSMLNGGTVFGVEQEKVPDKAPLAVVFRY